LFIHHQLHAYDHHNHHFHRLKWSENSKEEITFDLKSIRIKVFRFKLTLDHQSINKTIFCNKDKVILSLSDFDFTTDYLLLNNRKHIVLYKLECILASKWEYLNGKNYILFIYYNYSFIICTDHKHCVGTSLDLVEGSQTRGPRAACGPPRVPMRPVHLSKNVS